MDRLSSNCTVGFAERVERPTTRIIVLLLVLAVPLLSTLARNSWYLSSSDPSHFLIAASKAEIMHAQILPDQPVLQPTMPIALQKPIGHPLSYLEVATPAPASGITLSIQDRSPPQQLS